jgi:poly(hydroxyalkanoate) depolymerase family esterase
MHPDFQRLMRDATNLTRTGNLQAAAAAIRSALGSARPSAQHSPRDVLDVEVREVPGSTRPVPNFPEAEAPTSQPSGFHSGTFADATGGHAYKLFIPPNAGSRALPLVVMLHGCTQTPDDFAAGTAMNDLAREQGCFVLYPAQSQRVNPQRCWNWFKHSHQQRGRGEPAMLAGMVRSIMARNSIDAGRVYVAGLSAGGAMASILGETYPELFAAVGVHSGLAAGAATDLPTALAAMKGAVTARRSAGSGMPTIVFHGDADATVHPSNGEQVLAASVGSDSPTETHALGREGGRACTRRIVRAANGQVVAEHWLVHGASHAWSGGSAAGTYTDVRGPDASAEMLRFFLEHPRRSPH